MASGGKSTLTIGAGAALFGTSKVARSQNASEKVVLCTSQLRHQIHQPNQIVKSRGRSAHLVKRRVVGSQGPMRARVAKSLTYHRVQLGICEPISKSPIARTPRHV